MLESIINQIKNTPYYQRILGTSEEWSKEKEEQIENYIKKQYGLVREDYETLTDFVQRAEETVNNKQEPLSWGGKGLAKLLEGVRKHEETTKRVQKVTEEFLGIVEEPVDAYIGKPIKGAGGFNLGEPDGSGVIVIQPGMEEDYNIDIEMLTQDIKKYLSGIEVKKKFELNLPNLMMLGTHKKQKNQRDIFTKWLSSIYNNFDHTALHEGIHNLDNNAQPSRTNKKLNYAQSMGILLPLIPGIRHLALMPITAYSVDMESTAFKVSIDAYVDKSFKDVRQELDSACEEDKEKIDSLENTFYDMSSTFAKRVIKKRYLKNKKLEGVISSSLKIGTTYLLYELFDVKDVTGFWTAVSEGISYLYMAKLCYQGIDVLPKLTLNYAFRGMTNRYVNAWHKILRKEGVKEGFQNTLGMSCRERVKYAKNIEI